MTATKAVVRRANTPCLSEVLTDSSRGSSRGQSTIVAVGRLPDALLAADLLLASIQKRILNGRRSRYGSQSKGWSRCGVNQWSARRHAATEVGVLVRDVLVRGPEVGVLVRGPGVLVRDGGECLGPRARTANVNCDPVFRPAPVN